MKDNDKIIAITAAMLDGTGLVPVSKLFPDRVIDVGICEQHAVTMAAGLASKGYIPIVVIYSTFLQRAYDQIVHDVALQQLPVIFAIDRAGIVGDDGKTHQGIFDISYMRSIPNMIVSSPCDLIDMGGLLKAAVESSKPFSIRYPKGAAEGNIPDEKIEAFVSGKAELVKDGSDLAIISIGNCLSEAIESAVYLSKFGIECALLNARFIKPLDAKLIKYLAKKTGKIITIEENVLSGGFGSAVNELLVKEKLFNVNIQNIALPDGFIEHGSQEYLRAKYEINASGIIKCVKKIFSERLWQGI